MLRLNTFVLLSIAVGHSFVATTIAMLIIAANTRCFMSMRSARTGHHHIAVVKQDQLGSRFAVFLFLIYMPSPLFRLTVRCSFL